MEWNVAPPTSPHTILPAESECWEHMGRGEHWERAPGRERTRGPQGSAGDRYAGPSALSSGYPSITSFAPAPLHLTLHLHRLLGSQDQGQQRDSRGTGQVTRACAASLPSQKAIGAVQDALAPGGPQEALLECPGPHHRQPSEFPDP